MNHAAALALFGSCACLCHQGATAPCWCGNPAHLDPYTISHDDRVRYLGSCLCGGGVCERHHTDPAIATALGRLDGAARQARIAARRMRASDIAFVMSNRDRFPELFDSEGTQYT